MPRITNEVQIPTNSEGKLAIKWMHTNLLRPQRGKASLAGMETSRRQCVYLELPLASFAVTFNAESKRYGGKPEATSRPNLKALLGAF